MTSHAQANPGPGEPCCQPLTCDEVRGQMDNLPDYVYATVSTGCLEGLVMKLGPKMVTNEGSLKVVHWHGISIEAAVKDCPFSDWMTLEQGVVIRSPNSSGCYMEFPDFEFSRSGGGVIFNIYMPSGLPGVTIPFYYTIKYITDIHGSFCDGCGPAGEATIVYTF